MMNLLKNKKTVVGVLVLVVIIGLGLYGVFAPSEFECHGEKGSVIRIWSPAYMEMDLFVDNALAPAAKKRCGYVIKFSESEIDYREAARDITVVLDEHPDLDLLMLDEGLARDLAADGLIPQPSAVLFSIEEETGLDFFGIALVKTSGEPAAPDAPEELNSSVAPGAFQRTVPTAYAQEIEIDVAPEILEKTLKGLSAVDDVIKIAKGDATGLVKKRVKKAALKYAERKIVETYIEKSVAAGVARETSKQFGKAIAARTITKLNVAIGLASAATDIYDILNESWKLSAALADLEESLVRNLQDARSRIGSAAEEAAGLAFALLSCDADPREAEQRLDVLAGQVNRDYDFANELLADLHRTTGNQAEVNRQMNINDEIYKSFGAAADAAKAAIAARRAMGDECSLISLQPDPVDFGDVCVRDTKNISVRAKNFNKADIRVRETNLNEWPGPSHFYTKGQLGNYALAANKEHAYDIKYGPNSAGKHEAALSVSVELKILGTTLSEDRKVPVTGRGVKCEEESRDKYPKLSFSPDPVDFGSVCVGDSKTVTMTATNDGDYDLRDVFHVGISSPFSASPLQDVPRLSVGEKLEYSVTYTARPGRDETRFSVTSHAVDEFGDEVRLLASNIPLQGQGIDCAPKEEEAVISPEPAPEPEPEETPVPEAPASNRCEAICGAGRVKVADSLGSCSDFSQEFLCIQDKKACYDYLIPVGWQNDSGCCCIDPYIETSAAGRINCSKFIGWDANGYAVTKYAKYPAGSSTLPSSQCE